LRRIRAIFIVLFMTGLSGAAWAQVNLVLNPSFESGAIAPNWTVVTNGSGRARAVPAGAALFYLVAPALLVGNGTDEAVIDQSSPSTTILYQNVVLPANNKITAQVTVAFISHSQNVATDFYRVDIVQAVPATVALGTTATNSAATFAAGVLQTLYLQGSTTGSVASMDTAQFDISALAGQTIRIRAVINAEFNNTEGVLDNVRILATPLSAVSTPTLSEWSLIFLALLLAGAGSLYANRMRSVR
jgi:hypothetical protein